jgi:hypothetical protein
MKPYVFDLEGDGLYCTKIHCVSVNDGKSVKSTTDYARMGKFFSNAKLLIGHNIARFDVPTVERILGIKVEAKLVDTLALSWYLFPERVRHGLESWGEDFGVPKPEIDDWENLSPEEYINRCEEDTKINWLLWKKCHSYLLKLYGNEEGVWRLIDYLMFKLDCAREQERSRWKLDVEFAQKNLDELTKEHDTLYQKLSEGMPKVEKFAVRKKPSKPFKKDGTPSVAGAKWNNLLRKHGLPANYNGEVKEVVALEDPNPGSSVQIKDWLYSLGWVPKTFKYKRDKDTNDISKIPQVRVEEDGEKRLCDSVVKLIPKAPALEHLRSITVLSHRIGILSGFLKEREGDWVKAEIQGLTNTLRFKHKTVVNLPGVNKPYGKIIRGSLTAPEGYELCGSDMSSLEDRTKQHYMWEYDPEYVKEMNTEGFDPHLDIALTSGMMTQVQVDAYKNGDKSFQPIRHAAKQVNYSCTYGVTPAGLVRNTGMSLKEAETLHKAYWKRNWSLKAIAQSCKTKVVNGQMWLYNPVSKLWYTLRHEKDRFSTLNQGTGTYCFDMWVKKIRSKRPQLTAQFHDEIVLCVKKGNRDKATKLLKWAIQEVNKELKLNRDLDVDVQFGGTYAEIH